MKLRDLFWLTLIVALVLSSWIRTPEELRCPCCGSSYPTELVRSIGPW